MAHHEASTTADVASTPADAQGLEARLPMQPVHHEVEVTADEPSGQTVRSEAWIDVVEENRSLRWGVPGEPGYHGELDVDLVADGTSLLTVRLDTSHPGDPAVDDELHRALDGIKTSLEQAPTL